MRVNEEKDIRGYRTLNINDVKQSTLTNSWKKILGNLHLDEEIPVKCNKEVRIRGIPGKVADFRQENKFEDLEAVKEDHGLTI